MSDGINSNLNTTCFRRSFVSFLPPTFSISSLRWFEYDFMSAWSSSHLAPELNGYCYGFALVTSS